MNNKPQPQNGRGKQSWGEIQLAIAAVALTATLAFWNLFAEPQKQQEMAQAEDTATPPQQEPTQASTPTPGFLPVKIIFGGAAPQQRQVVVQQASAPKPKRKSGGSPNTGSSK